ncbi:Glutaredoxin-related protein 5, mitochondrial [Myotis brandtii]|uniref:Glutaredoxin-related protein 5, mitochondrial n=1 Tax=Myotis brandtii TaxID=109478 RepID=S7PIT3_MYOBR|nr:Glutaredoxin-related protein 5, mitochondrial [Myotis brandtii]
MPAQLRNVCGAPPCAAQAATFVFKRHLQNAVPAQTQPLLCRTSCAQTRSVWRKQGQRRRQGAEHTHPEVTESVIAGSVTASSFAAGIKDYSNWPTIPQVFLNGEFVGGCDILLQMHQNGDLVEELKKLGIRSALLDEKQDQDSK